MGLYRFPVSESPEIRRRKSGGALCAHGRRERLLLGPLAGGGTLQIGIDEALQIAAFPQKIYDFSGTPWDCIDFR